MLLEIAPLENGRGLLEAEAQKTVLLSETGKLISVLGECTSHDVTPSILSCHPSIISWSSELETSCIQLLYSLPGISLSMLVLQGLLCTLSFCLL